MAAANRARDSGSGVRGAGVRRGQALDGGVEGEVGGEAALERVQHLRAVGGRPGDLVVPAGHPRVEVPAQVVEIGGVQPRRDQRAGALAAGQGAQGACADLLVSVRGLGPERCHGLEQPVLGEEQEADDDVGHLHAGVVDVVLDLDAAAEPAQAADQHVAEDGVAQVPDVRRLVRIDIRMFHNHLGGALRPPARHLRRRCPPTPPALAGSKSRLARLGARHPFPVPGLPVVTVPRVPWSGSGEERREGRAAAEAEVDEARALDGHAGLDERQGVVRWRRRRSAHRADPRRSRRWRAAPGAASWPAAGRRPRRGRRAAGAAARPGSRRRRRRPGPTTPPRWRRQARSARSPASKPPGDANSTACGGSELVKEPFTSSDYLVRGGRSPSPRPRSKFAGFTPPPRLAEDGEAR